MFDLLIIIQLENLRKETALLRQENAQLESDNIHNSDKYKIIQTEYENMIKVNQGLRERNQSSQDEAIVKNQKIVEKMTELEAIQGNYEAALARCTSLEEDVSIIDWFEI